MWSWQQVCLTLLLLAMQQTCDCGDVVLQVQYAALHNYEDREEDFRADVVTLRRRFTSEGKAFGHILDQDVWPKYFSQHTCAYSYTAVNQSLFQTGSPIQSVELLAKMLEHSR